jgi:hypothetical protein
MSGELHVKAAIADEHAALATSASLTGAALDKNMELALGEGWGSAAAPVEALHGPYRRRHSSTRLLTRRLCPFAHWTAPLATKCVRAAALPGPFACDLCESCVCCQDP